MVPRDRIELSTPAFSGLCSANWATSAQGKDFFGRIIRLDISLECYESAKWGEMCNRKPWNKSSVGPWKSLPVTCSVVGCLRVSQTCHSLPCQRLRTDVLSMCQGPLALEGLFMVAPLLDGFLNTTVSSKSELYDIWERVLLGIAVEKTERWLFLRWSNP